VKVCLACSARFDTPGWTCPECGVSPPTHPYPRFCDDTVGDEGFPGWSFERLEQLEESSFWFRARNELIAWALAKHFPHARSFLEVGCGTGFVLNGLHELLPELRVTGAEPWREGLDVARRRLPDVELLQLDARRLPFDAEFDVAGAFDVLEHIDEDEDVLTELARTVRPGGGVILTVPQHPRLWSPFDDISQHRRRYTARELTRKLEAAGFGILRRTSFVTLLLPGVALARIQARRAGDAYDPYAEFAIPRWLDRALERVLAVERQAIVRGVNLPLGASLLVVAART
jgi:SAM-dependent methyltransferase